MPLFLRSARNHNILKYIDLAFLRVFFLGFFMAYSSLLVSPTEQSYDNTRYHKTSWALLNSSGLSSGNPSTGTLDYSDRSVQVVGTFGSGGSVQIQGSNDGGTTWSPLSNPAGTVINITGSSQINQITELAEQVKPVVTAGDATTSLTVWLMMRRDKI